MAKRSATAAVPVNPAFIPDSWSNRSRLNRPSAFRDMVRTVAIYSVAAVSAFWVGESFVLQNSVVFIPAHLQSGDFWPPDHGYCRECGDRLIPQVDELSACRHCEHCNVSYRHESLPATVELQQQIWK